MKTKSNKLLLTLTAILLTISFVATPVTALVPITTSDPAIENTETPSSDTAIFEELGSRQEGNTRATSEIVTSTYLDDGVYAFRNIGNGDLWMDLEQNIYSQSAHIQQCYYASSPADIFERAALFKITRVGTTNRYIVRLMMNNLLTFDFSGTEVTTKRIPANDSEVAVTDTIYIVYSSAVGGYTIRPYGEANYVCANNTQASGMSGAPDSFLKAASQSSAGNCSKWEAHKYTGAAKSSMSLSKSPSINDGLKVGDSTYISIYPWSTVVGANTPIMALSSSTASRALVLDVSSDLSFSYRYYLEGVKAGKVQLDYRFYDANGTSVYYGVQNYLVTPDLPDSVYYIQNAATNGYLSLHGASSSNGSNVTHWVFGEENWKQWFIKPASNGYFEIYSNYSGFYIGISSSDTSTVKQYSSSGIYTQWYFHETNDGRYALANRYWNSSFKVIAAPYDYSGNGTTLSLVTYTDDASLRDEWIIDSSAYELILCGIPDNNPNEDHDHISALTQISTTVTIPNSSVQLYHTAITDEQCLSYLKDASIFVFRGHGGYQKSGNTVMATLLCLDGPNSPYLLSHSAPNVGLDYTVISPDDDFFQAKLMVFVACYTGEGGVGENNFPTKAVACGARVAIGFQGSIDCDDAEKWTKNFFGALAEGHSVDEAIAEAKTAAQLTLTVCGSTGYRLPN